MSKSDDQKFALSVLLDEREDALKREEKAIAAMVQGLPGDAKLTASVQAVRDELFNLEERIKIAERAVQAALEFEASDEGKALRSEAVGNLRQAEALVEDTVAKSAELDRMLADQVAPLVATIAAKHQAFKSSLVGFYKVALAHNQSARLDAIVNASGLERSGADALMAHLDEAFAPLDIPRSQMLLSYQRSLGQTLSISADVKTALQGAVGKMRAVAEREGLPL